MAEKELAILVVAKGIAKATGQIMTLDRKLAHLGKATRNASANLQRGIAIAATAAGAGIVYAVKQASDFEAQLFTINTIARQTTDGLGGLPDGLDAIGDAIRSIARRTGTPLEELTQGYYDLLSAGITSADAPKVLDAANTLAIGGLASAAEAVDLLTTSINSYGGDATQAGSHADVFAKAIERGKVTAADIANSFANVGPLAATMGIEIEEIAAGYARLTANGSEAGEASTQMASALTALLKKTGPMEKLEKATNKNYAAIAGSKGLAAALQEMRTDADKAGIGLADLMGRKEGLLYLLQVTGPNLAAYNEDLAAMGDSAGTAGEQAAERMQGLSFQVDRLRANLQDAAITVGTELIPIFADLAEQATTWLTGHQSEIKAFAKDLAAGIQSAVTWLKQLDWNAIISTIKAGAAFAGGIVQAFLAAPAWLQQFLAVGFVANKFTGGVLGDIMGDLAKGLIKGVLGIQAGHVTVTAATATMSGGPGGPAAGPTAGGGPGIWSILGIAGIAAGVASILITETQKAEAAFQGTPAHTAAGNRDEVGRGFRGTTDATRNVGSKVDRTGTANVSAIREAKMAVYQDTAEQRNSANRIVAAINSINPITNVYITSRGVTSAQTSTSRSGVGKRNTLT